MISPGVCTLSGARAYELRPFIGVSEYHRHQQIIRKTADHIQYTQHISCHSVAVSQREIGGKLMLTRILLVFCSGAAVCLLSACIVLPTGSGDPNPFRSNSVGFIEVGVSTKEDIRREMSNFRIVNSREETTRHLTPKVYRDGRTWLYGQLRNEATFVVGYEGGADTIGDVDFRFLLINFNHDGVVQDFQVLRSEGGCGQSGVCVRKLGSDLEFQLLANDEEEFFVQTRTPPADHCDLFVFGNPPRHGPISVSVNGHRIFNILDSEHYFVQPVPRGTHEFSARYFNSGSSSFHNFECVGGRKLYLKLVPKRKSLLNPYRDYDIVILETESVESSVLRSRRLTLIEE
jgi:hypothetical protein